MMVHTIKTTKGSSKSADWQDEWTISGSLLEELGEINENWFEDLTVRCRGPTERDEEEKGITVTDVAGNSEDTTTGTVGVVVTPVPTSTVVDRVPSPSTPGPTGFTPHPGYRHTLHHSPITCHTLTKGTSDLSDIYNVKVSHEEKDNCRWKDLDINARSSTPKSRVDIEEGGLVTSTPDIPQSTISDSPEANTQGKHVHKSFIQTPKYSTPFFSPWPTKDDSFLRGLVHKTPGSLVRLTSVNRLREALGVDPSHTGQSWTSSLATTPRGQDGFTDKKSVIESSPAEQEDIPLKGAARKLFSPSVCDTDIVALDSTLDSTPNSLDGIHNNQDNVHNKTPHSEDPLSDVQRSNKGSGKVEVSVPNQDEGGSLKRDGSSSVLHDLVGTPPSRSYLRQQVARKRTSLRHSLTSQGAASKMVEHIMAESVEECEGNIETGSGGGEEVNVDQMNATSGDKITEDQIKVKSEEDGNDKSSMEQDQNVSVDRKERPDVEFTQLSPTHLYAICDAVTKSETSLMATNVVEETTTIRTELPAERTAENTHSDCHVQKRTTVPDEAPRKSPALQKTPGKSMASQEGNNDVVFSQISPSVMESIFSATESVSTVNQTGTKDSPSQRTPMSRVSPKHSKTNTCISENKSRTVSPRMSPVSGTHRLAQTSTVKGRSVGLRRKPGRFQYPSRNQISNDSAKKVINFQAISNYSAQPPSDGRGERKEAQNNKDGSHDKIENKATSNLETGLQDKQAHGDETARMMDGIEQEFDTDFTLSLTVASEKEKVKETVVTPSYKDDGAQTNMESVNEGVKHVPRIVEEDGGIPVITFESQVHQASTCVGFQIASGKKLNLDEATVKKYSTWFDEDQPKSAESAPSKISCLKNLNVHQSSKPSAKSCVNNNSDIRNNMKFPNHYRHLENKTECGSELGDARVPEMDKPGAKTDNDCDKLLPTCDKDPPESTCGAVEGSAVPQFVSFKTAAGNDLKIDESKWTKYGSWFQEELPLEKSGKDCDKGMVETGSTIKDTHHDYQTEVTVKEKCDTKNDKGNTAYSDGIPPTFVGFKTARGKDVKISETNLSKFEKWFEDEPGGSMSTTDPPLVFNLGEEPVNDNTDRQPPGFGTAAGKQLKIDSSAAAKFSKWFEEENIEGCSQTEPSVPVIAERDTDKATNMASLKQNEPKKDYSKLPKGYRPFKRPRMVVKTDIKAAIHVNTIEKQDVLQQKEDGLNKEDNCINQKLNKHPEKVELIEDKVKTSVDKDEVETGVNEHQNDSNMNVTDQYNEAFNDSLDNLTYTQITEATDAAQALLLEDNSQFDDHLNILSANHTSNNTTDDLITTQRVSLGGGDEAVNGPGPVLFKTASGKSLATSTEALMKVKHIFTEEDIVEEAAVSDVNKDEDRRISPQDGQRINQLTVPAAARQNSTEKTNEAKIVKETLPTSENLKVPEVPESKMNRVDQHTRSSGQYLSSNSGTLQENTSFSFYSGENSKKVLEKDEITDCVVPELKVKQTSGSTSGEFKQPYPIAEMSSMTHSDLSDGLTNVSTITKSKSEFSLEKDVTEEPVEGDTGTTDTGEALSKCPAFTTASGKSVNVSEKAINEAKLLLQNNEESFVGNDCIDFKVPGVELPAFSPASGKEVKISECALNEAQILLENDEQPSVEKNNPPSHFQGFSTASGKRVDISENGLKQSQSLLTKMEETPSDYGVERDGFMEETPQASSFVGFSTASGKSVKVSEKSLTEARSKLSALGDEDVDVNEQQNEIKDVENKDLNKATPATFLGFATAGGKKVSISETALRKVKQFFSEDEKHLRSDEERLMQEMTSGTSDKLTAIIPFTEKSSMKSDHSCLGFSTAGGKSVNISNSALMKAKKLLESNPEIDDESNQKDPRTKEESKTKLDVFSTAGGQQVKVCKDSLSMVRSADNDRGEVAPPSLTFTGFSTAGGRTVNISEDAMKKAKQFLTESELTMGQSDDRTEENQLDEDQEVMKEICESSKALLADCDDTFGEESSFVHSGQRQNPELSSNTSTARFPSKVTAFKAVTSTPEAFLSDRCLVSRRSTSLKPLISAPDKDLQNQKRSSNQPIYSWQGPTSYKDYHNAVTDDRLIEPSTPGDQVRLSHPIHQSTPVKQSTDSSSFITPYKTDTPASSFKPPLKASTPISTGGFKTPVKSTPKRSASEAGFITPVQKKSKGEGSGEGGEGSGEGGEGSGEGGEGSGEGGEGSGEGGEGSGDESTVIGKSLEEELLVDWGHEQDSIVEALSTTDLENLDKNCDELSNLPEEEIKEEDNVKVREKTKVKVAEEVCKARMKAKVGQAQRIKMKRERGGVKPQPGGWFSQRQGERGVQLKLAVGGLTPQSYTKQQIYCFGVRDSVLTVCAANAEDYRFSSAEFYEDKVTYESNSVRVGDGALLIWGDKSTAGKEEFCNAFLDMDGVDPKLTNREWIYNHYRWIVWKLAAMETAFPQIFGGRSLTPDRVMLQLKYRYDREVDNTQRSAIKKIFERDDTPAKVLVLCVSAVVSLPHTNSIRVPQTPKDNSAIRVPQTNKDNSAIRVPQTPKDNSAIRVPQTPKDNSAIRVPQTPKDNSAIRVPQTPKDNSGAGDGQNPIHLAAVVELTDGWYPIKAVLDPALTRLVSQGRLRVGDKVMVYSAELTGSQDAAPPLQARADTMLKVSGNCCRRASWFTRLGYHTHPQPPPLPLSSLYSDGGTVSCVDVVVTRIYPLQYMERTPDGGTVFRSERAEERVSGRFESARQRQLETIYSKVQTEFEKRACGTGGRSLRSRRGGRKYSRQEVSEWSTGEEIYEALEAATDQGSVESLLTSHQMELLTDHQRSLQELLHTEMQSAFTTHLEQFEEKNPKRNVTALLKVRVAGCSNRDIDSKSNTVLTIWRPSDDIREMLSEGKRFLIYHLSAGESKGRMKGNTVAALSGQRMTRYKNVPIDDNLLDLIYEPREVTDYREVGAGFQAVYGEVDCVGIVVLASPVSTYDRASGDEGQVQTVYIADVNGELMAVKAWGGTSMYGVEEVLKECSVVSMSSLSWRSEMAGRSRIPTLTITETTHITTNPKDAHIRTALDQLKNKVKNTRSFVVEMKERLHSVMNNASHNLHTPQSVPRVSMVSRLQETPRTMSKPVIVSTRSVVYPRSQTKTRVTPRTSMSSSTRGELATPSAHSLTSTDVPTTPHTPLTPGHDGDDDDPVLARKRSLQRLKAYKVSQMSDHTPVTPLYSSIPAKVRKAFKLPTMARSASPDLVKASTSRGRKYSTLSTPKPASKPDKLTRKLNFCDQDLVQNEDSDTRTEDKSEGSCDQSSNTSDALQGASVNISLDNLKCSKTETCNGTSQADPETENNDLKTLTDNTQSEQSEKRRLSDSDGEDKPQRKRSTRIAKT